MRSPKLGVLLAFICVGCVHLSPKSAAAACTSPSGVAGDLLFNSTSLVIQGCDGTNWKGWGRGAAGSWRDISTGWYHTCGIRTDNTAWCWGENNHGQVGNGTTGSNMLYPAAVSGGGTWMLLNAGATTVCGIKSGATSPRCWGEQWSYTTGDSSGVDKSVPTAVSFSGSWKFVHIGGDVSCAIKADDTLWCWGANDQGQWGSGATGGSPTWTPQAVSGGSKWKSVSTSKHETSLSFVCGIKSDNTGWCWGDGSQGQLGNGATSDSNVPVAISGGGTWKQINPGVNHVCGIKTDGTGWCWGDNSWGQLGRGGGSSSYSTPQALSVSGVTTWADIQSGDTISCGVKTDGSGWCWGYGDEGNIGDGATTTYNTPHEILSGAKWKTVHTDWTTCGIMQNGTLWCWGENQYGGQGVGNTNQSNTPQYVAASAAATCSSPTGARGDLVFNSDYHVLQWCDGSQWNAAGPISPGGPYSGCSSPLGDAGDLLFNSASKFFQYCDGHTWWGISR